MKLRQEAALDCSIDRKVALLLRLRKESANLPIAPIGQDDGLAGGNMEEIVDSDISSDHLQSVGAVEDLKLNVQCGNVTENKGSSLENHKRNGNPLEKKGSYVFRTGMSLKRKAVAGAQRC